MVLGLNIHQMYQSVICVFFGLRRARYVLAQAL